MEENEEQQPADIDSVLADPDFHSQPLGWRLSTLRANYPEFAALHPKDQGQLIAKTQQDSMGITAGLEHHKTALGGLLAWPQAPTSQLASPTQTPSPGRGGAVQQNNKPIVTPKPKTFTGTIVNGVSSIIPGAAKLARAALNTGQEGNEARADLMAPQADQFRQAGEDFERPGILPKLSAAGHALAGAVPVFGPAAAEIGENVGDGDFGAAAGNALMLGGPEAWNKLGPKSVNIPRGVKNVNTPAIEDAIGSLAPNVRMTPFQRAGQTGLESSAKNLKNMPGTANQAHEFYQGQQSDIAAEAQRRIGQQGSQGTLPSLSGRPAQVTNDVGAGQFVQDELGSSIKRNQEAAKQSYDYVRQETAKNVVPKQTGTSTSPILGPNGNPISSPVYTMLESPVDLEPIRAQLQPIYEDLANNLAPAKQQASTAFTALKNLMERQDLTHMNAMDFDKFLGALKSITRNGESPNLSNTSQRLATQVISAGEKGLDQALVGAGPDVIDALHRGRRAVAEYHDIDEFLQDIRKKPNEPYEPASIFDALTRGGNRAITTLETIKRHSPAAIDTIGRTLLNEMLDKATREGGWGRSAGADADWTRLGDDTKSLLYGPQVTKSLEQLFLGAKKLTPAEGSPTAGRLSAFASYGDVGAALAELLGGVVMGHPVAGAATAAATLYATRVRPAMLAKIAFQPAGANLLNQVMRLPVNSPAFNRAMVALNAMAEGQGKGQDPLGIMKHIQEQPQ